MKIIRELNPNDTRTCRYCGSEMRTISSIIWWCLGCGALHVPSDVNGYSDEEEWRRPERLKPEENKAGE